MDSKNDTTLTIDELRDYLANDILSDPTLSIADDQDLLLSGLLDSLNVVRVASYLEQRCEIQIPPEDLILEHFGSLRQIQNYVESRLPS